MSAFVVDASVAIKWFVPEIHSDAARRLLDRPHQYLAPDLLFAEVGNVIWKKVRKNELTRDEGGRLIQDFEQCAIEGVPCRTLVTDAHALAVRTDRTVYDALYLALAVRLKTQFITADERLWNAIVTVPALKPHIELLAATRI